jgi:hypothetical protein
METKAHPKELPQICIVSVRPCSLASHLHAVVLHRCPGHRAIQDVLEPLPLALVAGIDIQAMRVCPEVSCRKVIGEGVVEAGAQQDGGRQKWNKDHLPDNGSSGSLNGFLFKHCLRMVPSATCIMLRDLHGPGMGIVTNCRDTT